jgi:hypothetical protein
MGFSTPTYWEPNRAASSLSVSSLAVSRSCVSAKVCGRGFVYVSTSRAAASRSFTLPGPKGQLERFMQGHLWQSHHPCQEVTTRSNMLWSSNCLIAASAKVEVYPFRAACAGRYLPVVHLGGISCLAGKRSCFDFIEVSRTSRPLSSGVASQNKTANMSLKLRCKFLLPYGRWILGGTARSGRGGRRFKSCHSDQKSSDNSNTSKTAS